MASSKISSLWSRFYHYAYRHLNFYRIHLLVFCITPVIMSAVMYASNGRYPVAYVDCLFNCVSAMTVTGLTTINLSGITGWQQTILFIQMGVGNIVVVSWIMVVVRKKFFEAKVDHIVEGILSRNSGGESGYRVRRTPLSLTKKMLGNLRQKRGESGEKVRTDMIQRVSAAPQLLNPNGQISIKTPNREADEGDVGPGQMTSFDENRTSEGQVRKTPLRENFTVEFADDTNGERHLNADNATSNGDATSPRRITRTAETGVGFPRTLTVEFQEPEGPHRRTGRRASLRPTPITTRQPSLSPEAERNPGHPLGGPIRSLPRTSTMHTHQTHNSAHRGSHHTTGLRRSASVQHEDLGFGGFPMPHQILARIASAAVPKLSEKLQRSMSVPARTMSMGSQRDEDTTTAANTGIDMNTRTRSVPYISFEAIIGRNSRFYDLQEEELEELGGVEYRALRMLLWLVPVYYLGTQLIAFIVIAPYMSLARWAPVFDSQIRPLSSTWYSAFVISSAFTNSGMSLVDQSMIPFQSAYPQLVFLIWVILAGNTSYPAFFRLMIWIGSKIISRTSRAAETLQFLLDHPRRCFVYLFPSHQTWFLVLFILFLSATDWVSFLLLDIGNSEIENIPVGTRMLDGLLQSAAVRSAGFGIVSLSNLAPAVQVLYLVMMYVSVYPIALSVRSSNVYEERSLGLEEDGVDTAEPTSKVWGSYVAWHARRQLAFDMWWIVFALVLICIVERGPIDDKSKDGIDIFPILFEVISAYGTVGLSLGAPNENYSLSGALHPLSKVILCMVMIRGRHRGLPVAIDRAVMLPHEFRDSASLHRDPNDAEGSDHESNVGSGRRLPPRSSTTWEREASARPFERSRSHSVDIDGPRIGGKSMDHSQVLHPVQEK